jgi:hypothetical protein
MFLAFYGNNPMALAAWYCKKALEHPGIRDGEQ